MAKDFQIHYIPYIEIFILLLLSVYWDTKNYKIPNKLVLSGILLGLVTTVFIQGWMAGVFSMIRILVFMTALMPLFLLKFLGAGDIKLLASVGAFFGYKEVLFIVLYSFIAGGFIGSFVLLARKNGIERFRKLMGYLKTIFYTMSVPSYPLDKSDKASFFRFSYAILAGFLLYFIEKIGWIKLFI